MRTYSIWKKEIAYLKLDVDSNPSYTSIYLNNSSQNEWVQETHSYTSSTQLVTSVLTMKRFVWLSRQWRQIGRFRVFFTKMRET